MSKIFGIGVIGCGNILVVYMWFVLMFVGIEMCVCVDMNMDVVKVWVEEFGLCVEIVDGFLVFDDIDIVVNLIVLNVYYEVLMCIFKVGKYVYLEKLFVLIVEEG